jgi:hypothetical protein
MFRVFDEPAGKGWAVSAKQTPTRAVGRYVAPMVALVAIGTVAACSSDSSGTRTVGPTTAPSSTLGPWHGSLTASPLPAPVHTLRAVTCPTARRCWAVGSTLATASSPAGAALVATTDGGATWTAETVPPTVSYLSAVACASTRSCTAVGQVGLTGAGPGAVLTTANGGATWVLQTVPAGTTDVTAVDCRTGGRCTALGVVAGRVTTLMPSSPSIWGAGGALPPVASAATGLSCIDGGSCWATASQSVDVDHVVGVIAATSDGGTTWTLQHVPAGTGALQGIDCTSSAMRRTRTSCTAVGTTSTVLGGGRVGQGVVLSSANGGASWVPVPLGSTSADLLGVSCAAGPCAAVGTTVASASQAGVAILTGAIVGFGPLWRRTSVAHVALPLTAVSCVSLSACVMVGESVTAHLSSG